MSVVNSLVCPLVKLVKLAVPEVGGAYVSEVAELVDPPVVVGELA